MTIRVHHYEQRDGMSVCKRCGMVENKDRVGPSWCSGRLPTVMVRKDTVDAYMRVVDAARLFRKADTGGGFDDRVACGKLLDEALAALEAREATDA